MSSRLNFTITSYHIISHHITSYHIISHHITSYHIISYHIISHHITSYHIISHHITSHHITSYHIISHHITSYHIISYHIISHHITSYHIISHHIPRERFKARGSGVGGNSGKQGSTVYFCSWILIFLWRIELCEIIFTISITTTRHNCVYVPPGMTAGTLCFRVVRPSVRPSICHTVGIPLCVQRSEKNHAFSTSYPPFIAMPT